MRIFVALAACLAAATALPACFDPLLSCRLTCNYDTDCPTGLTCQAARGVGLCARSSDVCEARDAGPDAADAPLADGGGQLDAMTDARPEARPAPMMICARAGGCIELSAAVREGLVLWLDPSNLPDVNQPVSTWIDQSGQGNDAHAVRSDATPMVTANGVMFVQDPNGGTAFRVDDHPSLDFGAGDFLVLVVANVATGYPGSLFEKTDNQRPPDAQQIWLRYLFSSTVNGDVIQGTLNSTTVIDVTNVPQGRSHLYALRRTQDQVELMIDGTLVSSATIDLPDRPTTSTNPLYLGMAGDAGPAITSYQAAVTIRGTVGDVDLNDLESFLMPLTSP